MLDSSTKTMEKERKWGGNNKKVKTSKRKVMAGRAERRRNTGLEENKPRDRGG